MAISEASDDWIEKRYIRNLASCPQTFHSILFCSFAIVPDPLLTNRSKFNVHVPTFPSEYSYTAGNLPHEPCTHIPHDTPRARCQCASAETAPSTVFSMLRRVLGLPILFPTEYQNAFQRLTDSRNKPFGRQSRPPVMMIAEQENTVRAV